MRMEVANTCCVGGQGEKEVTKAGGVVDMQRFEIDVHAATESGREAFDLLPGDGRSELAGDDLHIFLREVRRRRQAEAAIADFDGLWAVAIRWVRPIHREFV